MSKKILITGSSNGFGFDASKYLAKAGHTVYATMRGVDGKNKAAAAELREFAKTEGLTIEVVELDVTSDESVEAAISQIPTVDVLINNAGVGYSGPVEAFSTQEFNAQMDVNVTGTFRVAKAVLPGMRSQRSGLIIQVSSIAGRCATPGFGIYYCSKWALEGLSEAMRYELGPLGIDVVLVEPGPFSTGFFANVIPGENQELASEYSHVGEFSEGFGQQVTSAFEDNAAPTDPMDIVKAFGTLINTPAGKRPLRTMVGLDFGMQKLNDATEPIRQEFLKEMGLNELDGPSR